MLTLTAKHFQSLTKRNSDFDFPKYSKPVLNIATQNSKATQVKTVGSMKELFTEFLATKQTAGHSVEAWQEFYFTQHKGQAKIATAADKLWDMLSKMPLDKTVFTKAVAEAYITDLVINKTHYGMSGEYHSVLAVAKYFDLEHRWSTAEEETQGIDAWIGDYPVQVKPADSVKKHHVRNHADTDKTLVITYESKKDRCFVHNPEFISDATLNDEWLFEQAVTVQG
jgi:hypothetical protein